MPHGEALFYGALMAAASIFNDITGKYGLNVHTKKAKDVDHQWANLTPSHRLFCFESEPRFLTLSIKGDGTHRIDTHDHVHIDALERICKRLSSASEHGNVVVHHSPETLLESFLRALVTSDDNAREALKTMVSKSNGLLALNMLLGLKRDEVRAVLMDCLIDIVPELEMHLERQLNKQQRRSF